MKNYQVARNWNRDGWTETDWDHITECAENLRAIAAEFDNAVGGGGGGFDPSELAELSKRAQRIVDWMKRVSGGYVSAA